MQTTSTLQPSLSLSRPLAGAPPMIPLGPPASPPVCEAAPLEADSWDALSIGEVSAAPASPSGPAEAAQAAAVADASAPRVEGPRVFRIGKAGVSEVARRSDGGYKVEGPTRTVVYWGKDAVSYLARREHFSMDTEVIVPRGTRIRVTTGDEVHEVSRPGAVLLAAGAEARVDVLEGQPMVIRSQNAPVWYGRLGPEGEHRDDFEELARINSKLYNWHTYRGAFSDGDREALKTAGVLRDAPDDGRYVEWQVFPSSGALRRHLEGAGISQDVIDRTMPVYQAARERRLYEALPGRIGDDHLPPRLTQRLLEDDIATRHGSRPEDVTWASDIRTEQELVQKLADHGYGGPEVHDIIDAWHKTTRSGYDNSGLAFEHGKVVAYDLADKINMWNGQPTEWMVNSTAYAGESAPFSVGVSYVQAAAPREAPTDFHEIRPLETLHRHPVTEAREQTEAYLVRSGRAALVTVTDRGPEVHVLEAGDLAVVEPDVVHCVSAFQGPYEHLCAQVPSAFQYGFMFKQTQEYGTFGLTEQDTGARARAALASGKSGTFALKDVPASPPAPGPASAGDEGLGFCIAP